MMLNIKKISVVLFIFLLSCTLLFAGGKQEGTEEEMEKETTTEEAATEETAEPSAKKFARQFEINEVVEFRSFSRYKEAPELSSLVDDGKIPPVSERLPKEPRVIKANVMPDGPGVYGGVMRGTTALSIQGWNWGAGNHQAWYGINQQIQEALIEMGPSWQLEEPMPIPNLAQSWEWSSDGTQLTMNLIEGAKWSDGAEFTADDVLFTYNDCILNDSIPSFTGKGAWTFGDKPAELEKLDNYTIRWTFDKPYSIRALYMMGYINFSIAPKHVLESHHPEYNSDKTYEDFINALPPQDLPAVTLGPWVPIKYEPDQLLIMQRNPFFWQVDEEGKQLPYHNEVRFHFAKEGVQRTLNVIAGEGDVTYIENLKYYTLLKKESQKPEAHFKVRDPISFTTGIKMTVNLSLYKGINTDRDQAVREMLREKDFRVALSHATDREAIAEAALPGPLTEAWYGGYPRGCPFYDEDAMVKHTYSTEKASELLAGLGFEDTDGDGTLNWPEDSIIAGDNLVLNLYTSNENPSVVDAAEQLVEQYSRVGIEVQMQSIKSDLEHQKEMAGEYDLIVDEEDALMQPFINPDVIGPVGPSTPEWHLSGPGGKRDLLPFEEEIQQLLADAAVEQSASKRSDMYSQIMRLVTENEYYFGLYQFGYATGIAKRFKNIQPDVVAALSPNYLFNNIPSHQIWTPKDQQIEEFFPSEIPTPEDY